MSTTIKEGDAVTCGICRRETTVNFVSERGDKFSYDLNCRHRNGYCEACGKLVRDTSETISEVHPHCETCDGALDDDE